MIHQQGLCHRDLVSLGMLKKVSESIAVNKRRETLLLRCMGRRVAGRAEADHATGDHVITTPGRDRHDY